MFLHCQKKEAREEIIGEILLKEFKDVEIKDENFFTFSEMSTNNLTENPEKIRSMLVPFVKNFLTIKKKQTLWS